MQEFPAAVPILIRWKIHRRIKQCIRNWKPDIVVHTGKILSFQNTPQAAFFVNEAMLQAYPPEKSGQITKFFAASAFIQQQLIYHHQVSVENIRITPLAFNPLYKSISGEEKETIKFRYSKQAEYFLYNHRLVTDTEFIPLLKAFSIFKKRLQTGMKLLIPCNKSLIDKKCSSLLETYRFKEDILFTGEVTAEEMAGITAAAYAVIQIVPLQPSVQDQDLLQCAVPVLILQPEEWIQPRDCYEYARASSPEEIAAKLMLLYKNESYRAHLISTSQQLLPQFSAEATSKTFHQALLHTVTE
ncbi:MAG TPA: hypothetical protein VFV46_09855 [Lacibacter sp.]|nr:hypothetical protein [Lacibacter sp.]